MLIRSYRPEDMKAIVRIWNRCVDAGEVLYFSQTEESFRRIFLTGEGRNPDLLLIAEEDGQIVGMIQGVAPDSFRGCAPESAYLTVLMVDVDFRGRGIGRSLLEALARRMVPLGARRFLISNMNPVQLSWRIPGAPGHDHNNMPGADSAIPGYGFLEHMGFSVTYRNMAMYRPLADYSMPEEVKALREKLKEQGMIVGPYDARLNCDYDSLCDHVNSEYWRDVLRSEIQALKEDRPNADERMWADGVPPKGPRMLLTAVHGSRIVAFTGPVDLQSSGRGWFTGICTDPAYEGRGIATVLFHLLMDAFVREGAAFTTLFTGVENHAQKIYLRAGLRPVREFHLMTLSLSGQDGAEPD